ncbi:haloacid dehalogenase type II [Desertibaculum subflavum]|uniref:haloacid dehalogenase type II n=1 Tax=Desertibaculum subflavum TaxID=2268458 RepID=UPI000E66F029
MAAADRGEVKALLFDVFGTVVDWRSSIAREARAFAARRGSAIDGEAFADAWRGLYQPAMEEIRSGRRPFVKLDVLHRENLEKVLQQFGIEGVAWPELEELNRAWHRLDPWPDTVAGLTRLKSKFIIATQSNGNVALMVNMAKRAGLPWDTILGAEVVRHYKPAPAAYTEACAMLGLPPDECMMVAAHNNDLLAAKRQGMKTAFVARPDEFGRGVKNFDLAPADGIDIGAASFLELADKLGCD